MVPELNVPRVGGTGEGKGSVRQARLPERCTKRTDLIVLRAAAANTPVSRSPLSSPPSTLTFLTQRVLLPYAPLLGACLLRRPPFPCGRQSRPAGGKVPAAIVGALDAPPTLPRRPGLSVHPGSAPRALPSRPRLRGWDLERVSHTTRWLLFRIFSSAGKTPPFCQTEGAQGALWVLLRPFHASGQDRLQSQKESQGGQGVDFSIILSALAVSPPQWCLLSPELGIFAVALQHVGGCNSVWRTSAKVCRGGLLANIKYTMSAFFSCLYNIAD